MKRSCIFILLSVLTNTHTVLQTRLPNNFYLLDQTGQNNLFDASKQPAAFYIFVNTSSSLPLQNNAVYQTLLSFATTTPVIPAGFCRDLNGSGPIISLYFNWQDKVGFKNIRDFGTIFAKGIHELSTGYNAPCIIVSLGRAGLLVNAASSLWNSPSPISPLPIVIQIGTPLPQPNSQFQDLMPNATTIQRLFHYYSQQPFITDQPTLNPPYGFDYDQPIQGLDIYKIIVLLHNQQPLQTALCMPLLTQSIITYSANAQTNYIKNRNLFLEISKKRKLDIEGYKKMEP